MCPDIDFNEDTTTDIYRFNDYHTLCDGKTKS